MNRSFLSLLSLLCMLELHKALYLGPWLGGRLHFLSLVT